MALGAENGVAENIEDRGRSGGAVGDRDGARNDAGRADGQCVAVAPMPASIVRAISAIKRTVEAVKKGQKNSHGGYMFASTDDIYAAVARKMGEVGYHVHALEEKCEIVRIEKPGKDGVPITVQWAHVVYSFLHATEEDTWAHPKDRRTLFIQVTGPQTFQAAQSFCEKSFIRSLLKLPTGDMDLDGMPQADSEEEQLALSSPRKRKSSSQAKKDGDDATFNAIVSDIRSALSGEHLRHIRTTFADEWSTAPARWAELLDHEYEDKMATFSTRQAAE